MTRAGASSFVGSEAIGSLVAFSRDIKIAHSIFALPFAASAVLLAEGLAAPTVRQGALLLACMVTARSFAMGINRFLDRNVDAANPRTKGRKIPAGELSPRAGLTWTIVAALLFMGAAASLSALAAACAPFVLAILAAYSLMKHLTWLTHWYLGLCLGVAPIGVEVALSGRATPAVLAVGAAVAFWTAGFDLLYSLQDMRFDRRAGLRSFPARFGAWTTVTVSRVSFGTMVALLAYAGIAAGRSTVYFVGVAAVAAVLALEHWLVRDARLDGRSKNLNLAFFNANAYVSVLFLAFVVADRWLA